MPLPPVRSLVLALALLLAAGRNAHADQEGGFAWGALATEASLAGVFALNFAVKSWPSGGPTFALNYAPLVLGPGLGFLAHYAELDAEPAYAIHGAGMMGLNLLLVGTMIDGLDQKDGLKLGTFAWTLGAVGSAAGAWFGATQVDGLEQGGITTLVAPPMAMFFGGVIIGGLGALLNRDSDKNEQRFVFGATVGLTAGLVGAVIHSTLGGESSEEVPRELPTPSISHRPTIFSFGGAF